MIVSIFGISYSRQRNVRGNITRKKINDYEHINRTDRLGLEKQTSSIEEVGIKGQDLHGDDHDVISEFYLGHGEEKFVEI